MKIGNWKVDEQGITWESGLQRFVIGKDELLNVVDDEEQGEMYECLINATEEDWLTEDDLYDLNYAFVYAAALTGDEFDYEVFDTTVAYQYELLEEEESDQPSLGDLTEEDADREQQRKEGLSERD